MRRLLLGLLCTLAVILNGCAGCSKSGRQAAREEAMRRQVPTQKEPSISSKRDAIVQGDSQRSISELYTILAPSVFTVYSNGIGGDVQQGSGFLLSKRGIGVSNAHVFLEGGEHFVEFVSGVEEAITLLELNRTKDYAIFRVNGEVTACSLIVSDQIPAVGDDVFAIGSPLGLKNTLSKGIVSNLHKEQEMLIQTTAPITNGSSGGPLFNRAGEVVGVTTSGYEQGNLNFAIPISEIPWAHY